MTDRGASDVIGFILVFALVTSTVTIAYTSGITELKNARDFERIENGGRAFDVLADNLADIHRGGAPSRATEIKLAGSSLTTGDKEKFMLEVANPSGSDDHYNASNLRPLIFSVDDENTIVYEAGAVIRTTRQGARMIREPNMQFTKTGSRRSVSIPYIQTVSDTQTSFSGSKTVLVRGDLVIPEIDGRYNPVLTSRSGENAPHDVTFTLNTTEKRAIAWERYLESEISWNNNACDIISPDDNTVECSFATDTLDVTRTTIEIQFQ